MTTVRVELREWFRCSACGDGVRVDEDGCCVTCGRDATVRGGKDGVFCASGSGRCGLTLRILHGRLIARAISEGFILSGGLSRVHELTGVLTGLDDIPS